jgi:hypothetical protein
MRFSIRPFRTRDDVTVVLTSCNRYDLLGTTLASFRAQNTDRRTAKIIVVEDGENGPVDICRRYDAELIVTGRRVGQIKAVDLAYSMVGTPYIFHLEDDWEFYKHGFIERSRAVLDHDPSTVCVWLRAWNDLNGHPLSFQSANGDFAVAAQDMMGPWHGFSFNPGLRRLSDYQALGSYAAIAGKSEHYEAEISMHYRRLSYRAVVLDRDGFVRHIGEGRHVQAFV